MSEETKAFIDKLADGDNAGAGEAFKDALRVKVGNQLDQARKDMAGNLSVDIRYSLCMLCVDIRYSL